MPTYEYKCDACGVEFERFQSIRAMPVKVCPKCKKSRVRRLISSGAGLIFKGSGFYITDYRSDGYKKAAQNEAGSGTTSSSSSSNSGGGNGSAGGGTTGAGSPKAESKPAAKSGGKASDK